LEASTKKGDEGKISKEAYAYTPGLKTKSAMIVARTRRLPIPGEVLVAVGDKVNYDTVVARTQIPGDPEVVKAAILLEVEPEDLSKYLKKKIGERVLKGESMAGYKTLFGLIKRDVPSPLDGTIESISNLTGQVIVRAPPTPLDMNAYIPGKVVNILPQEGAVVETNAAFIQGIFGLGGESHGKIRLTVESPREELLADHITSEDRGAVLIGGSSVALDGLRKAVEVGASCVVVGGIEHKDATTFMGEEIGVAITGEEEVGLTLIVTEGFGKMKMAQHTFDLLKRFEGCLTSVNGATQIRAGVQRPEIIIPHEKSSEQVSVHELASGMLPGTPIRVIRQPYFGAIGRVVSLPVELQMVESGSYVRVLTAELEGRGIVTIPRANVEIIEE